MYHEQTVRQGGAVEGTLVLTRRDVAALLDLDVCIAAVEGAMAAHATGRTAPPAIAGVHVDGGGFHIKAAALTLEQPYFAAKVNANFPDNPAHRGLPTVQGAALLFEAV